MGLVIFQPSTVARSGAAALRADVKNRRINLNRSALALLSGAKHVVIVVDPDARQFGIVGCGDNDPKRIKITGLSGKTLNPAIPCGDLFDKLGIKRGRYLVTRTEIKPGTFALVAQYDLANGEA